MRLTSVLLDRALGELIDEKDYRVRSSSMLEGAREAVEQLVEDFEHFFCRLRPEAIHWPGEWQPIVRARLEVEGPQGVFPFNPDCARRIVSSYRTPTTTKGQSKPLKNPARRSPKSRGI